MEEEKQHSRYESDRTRQERREMEKEKLHKMRFREKIDYIWTYYKVWMGIALAIILICVIIGQSIYNSQFESVCSIVVLNNLAMEGEELENDIRNYLEEEDKYHTVEVDYSMSLTGNDSTDYNSIMKVTAIFAARNLDIMVAPKEWIEYFAQQEAFYPIEEYLTEEEIELYGGSPGDYAIHIPADSILTEYGVVVGEDTCVAITSISPNPENAKKVLSYIMNES